MNKDMDSMQELLRRYRFDSPVPPEVRRHFSGNMPGIFRDIMKKSGCYSLFFGLISCFYFLFKRVGSLISIKTLITLILIVTLVSGGIVAYYFLTMTRQVVSNVTAEEAASQTAPADAGTGRRVVYSTLGVEPVKSGSVDTTLLDRVNKSLAGELIRLKGPGFSAFDSRGKETPFGMSGFVEQIDGSIVISVKVVDNRTSAIVLVAREMIESPDDIDGACGIISSKVVKSIKDK